MLIEFSVENFLSIKDKVTLSLLASTDKSLDNNLIKTDVLKKDSLLRSAVLYGANASGKTNVILALNFLNHLIINSHTNQKGTKIKYSPFKLNRENLSMPSKFEVVFIKNDIKYIYGASMTDEKIVDEYLYYYPKGSRATIFERKNTNNYKFTIDKTEQKFLSNRTLENVLYISNSTQLNYPKTSEAFEWFKDNLRTVGPTDHPSLIDTTVELLNKEKTFKEYVLKALIKADLGISDISASIETISIDDLPTDFPENMKVLLSDGKNELKKLDIKTTHKIHNIEGNEINVQFEFNEESDGTQRIFSLIGPWINALINGHILVIDELDTKLHHLLNVFLIKMFNDPSQNKSNAQLVFTTHNTNLLDLDLFRRDQIWFTEKNPDIGNTDLYSLIEFSPRKDKNIQKGYLAGRYGAIPFISGGELF